MTTPLVAAGRDASWPAAGPGRRRPRLFASAVEQPRSRRATDVILLAGSVLGIVFLGALAAPPPGIEGAFMRFVGAVPNGLLGLWRTLLVLFAALALGLLIACVVARRFAVARDLLLAAAVALGLSLVVGRIAVGSWPAVWDSLRSAGNSPYFPPLGLAVPAAVTITASPHLTRPARRAGRWLTFAALLSVVLHGTANPTGALAALLVAAAAGAIVHLAFGSSDGRPSVADVADALSRLGVGAHALRVAQRQPAGVFVVDAVDDAGEPFVVKVYGRDAYDTQLVTTVWRTIWYREPGSPTSFGRLQQAEHEAFLTLLAGQAGVRTHRVVTATRTPENDVLLVLRQIGRPLAETPELWDERTVDRAWATLRLLHGTGIAHGQLDDRHLVVDEAEIALIDFRGGAIAPRPDRLRTDQMQLLVATALAIGVQPAVAAAARALGHDTLAAALPFLQVTALTTGQRRAVRDAGLDLDDLRKRAAEQTGVEIPELQRMRRVSPRTLLQVALMVVAFLALAKGVGGLDFELLGEQLRDATWWLIITAVVVAQVPRLTDAMSVMGASPVPLALGPVYALQLASAYVGLAVPSSAARIAVSVRFFQRHGLRPGAALAVGAIDGFGQFAVEISLLVGILVFSSAALDLNFGTAAPGGLVWLLVIVIAVGVAVALALVLLPKIRRKLFELVGRMLREAMDTLRGMRSPRRLLLLIGGNLGTRLLLAFTLQILVRGIGFNVGYADALLIIVSVALLAGIMPIPGGIGVVEGGIAFGLVRAGLPEEAAFAVALSYRFATFYLPPVWGFFALRWLERNKHL